MLLHTAHPAERPLPSLWAKVVAWFAVALLLCGSVAEAGHLHHLQARQGAADNHAALSATFDGEGASTCTLCLLNGSAVAVHALRSAPTLYTRHTIAAAYNSRMVPLRVPFALCNRPPPAA